MPCACCVHASGAVVQSGPVLRLYLLWHYLLQVLQYEVGQYYGGHHDFIPAHSRLPCGPRVYTLFMYLSEVEEGGETELQNPKPKPQPKPKPTPTPTPTLTRRDGVPEAGHKSQAQERTRDSLAFDLQRAPARAGPPHLPRGQARHQGHQARGQHVAAPVRLQEGTPLGLQWLNVLRLVGRCWWVLWARPTVFIVKRCGTRERVTTGRRLRRVSDYHPLQLTVSARSGAPPPSASDRTRGQQAVMGGQQSREPPAEGESEKDKKDKKAKKYEQPAPTRVGKKKKKKSGPAPSQKLPDVKPTTKCRLRLLKLDRVHDYLLMEQEFVARQEQIKPMEEKAMEERAKVDDIRGSPMGVATLEEMIDDNHAIISSSVGPEYYVNIMSFVDKDQLEPGSSLLTHNKVNSIVGILADEVDPMVSVMKVDKAPTESYADIGGLETQIQEIKEAVELPLTHPELYEDIGIKPPKGVILYGEPGTGKTLLAKAVANQTSATFLRVTGSELIQKYLGDGPKLVRELFRVAEENAPTIVFIDEIDAVGTKRYDSQSGGEREIQRTMLELLNQLDGFDARTDVK
eukprot:scaffold55589_cov57-Phaeocystis_antarctica.AAC.6